MNPAEKQMIVIRVVVPDSPSGDWTYTVQNSTADFEATNNGSVITVNRKNTEGPTECDLEFEVVDSYGSPVALKNPPHLWRLPAVQQTSSHVLTYGDAFPTPYGFHIVLANGRISPDPTIVNKGDLDPPGSPHRTT